MKCFDILKIRLPHSLSSQKCLLNYVWICNWFHSLEVPFRKKLFANKFFPGTSHSHPMMPHPCHGWEVSGFPQSAGACLDSWFPWVPPWYLLSELTAGLPSVCVTHSLKVRHEAQHWHRCSFVALTIKVQFMECGHRCLCGGSSGCFYRDIGGVAGMWRSERREQDRIPLITGIYVSARRRTSFTWVENEVCQSREGLLTWLKLTFFILSSPV